MMNPRQVALDIEPRLRATFPKNAVKKKIKVTLGEEFEWMLRIWVWTVDVYIGISRHTSQPLMQIPVGHQFQSTTTSNYKITLPRNFSKVNCPPTKLCNAIHLKHNSWNICLTSFFYQVGLQTQSIPPELVKAAFGRSVEVWTILDYSFRLYLFVVARWAGWLPLNQGRGSSMRWVDDFC